MIEEAEWLELFEIERVLRSLPFHPSARSLRLLSVACCRRIWDHLDEDSRRAVDLLESYLHGQASEQDLALASAETKQRETGLAAARRATVPQPPPQPKGRRQGRRPTPPPEPTPAAEEYAARAVRWALMLPSELPPVGTYLTCAIQTARMAILTVPAEPPELALAEGRIYAALGRCIAGDPFHSVSFDPRWRTDSVASLAERIYAASDFAVLPVLADALEEAGCRVESIVNHCRGSGPHFRGCWVLDLILLRPADQG